MNEETSIETQAFLQAVWEEIMLNGFDEVPNRLIPAAMVGVSNAEDVEQAVSKMLNSLAMRDLLVSAVNTIGEVPESKGSSTLVHAEPFWQLIHAYAECPAVIALIGESGMGKSYLLETLLRTAMLSQVRCALTTFKAGMTVGGIRRRLEFQIQMSPENACLQTPPIFLIDDLQDRNVGAAIIDAVWDKFPDALVIYGAKTPIGFPSERIISLSEVDQKKSHLPEGFTDVLEKFNRTRWKLPSLPPIQLQQLHARLAGVPIAISLMAGALANDTQLSSTYQLNEFIYGSSTQTVQNRIVEKLIANLSDVERTAFGVLLTTAGPIDLDFARALHVDDVLIQRLFELALIERGESKVWVTEPVRSASLNELEIGIEHRRIHLQASLQRASEIVEANQAGKWTRATLLFEDSLHELPAAFNFALENQDNHSALRLATQMCRFYFESEEMSLFDQTAKPALDIAVAEADTNWIMSLQGIMGARYLRAGEVQEARTIWESRLQIALESGDDSVAVDAYTDLGALEYEAGNREQALERLDAAERLAEIGGYPELYASAILIRAHLELQSQNLIQTRVLLKKAEELKRDFSNRDQALFVHQTSTSILVQLGDVEAGRKAALELLANAYEGDRRVICGWALRKLAEFEMLEGKRDKAVSLLCAAIQLHSQDSSRHRLLAEEQLKIVLDTHRYEKISAALNRAAPWETTVREVLQSRD